MRRAVAVARDRLAGKEVALAGHFSAMTQDEAARVVEASGGRWARAPRSQTDYLVIGQEGWPFERSGHVTRNVALARTLRAKGARLAVITEQQFMELAGLEPDDGDEPRRMYSTAELSRLLGIPGPRIRAWARRGLIKPARSESGVDWYDFRQVTALRQLLAFSARGARPETILASLEQVRLWLPEAEDALAMLARFVQADELVLADGSHVTPSGQLRLPLGEVAAPIQQAMSLRPSTDERASEELLDEGRRLAEAGRLDDAERVLRKAMFAGGDRAEVCFQLGELLAQVGRKEEALDSYLEAAAARPGWADTWSRCAGVLVELERFQEAVEAAEHAVACDADNPGAHFNLALALLACGRAGEARLHGRIYLKHDAGSPMAVQLRDLLGL
jgi:tetratricopeptide (TPR) repeat protein